MMLSAKGNDPEVALTHCISSGVTNMPIKPDALALNTAEATSPLAIAVIATDEEMVDAMALNKKKPNRSSSLSNVRVAQYNRPPNNGNKIKVVD